MSELEQVKAERDRLHRWYMAVDAEAVTIGMAVEPTDDAKAALGRVLDWNMKVALDPSVSADARALRDTYLEERDRLAAEVATLRESLERRDIELKEALDQIAREQSETRALVHRHVEERSALQREVVRLTAQWERLFGNLRDRRLTLFGYSAEQQVAIEDVFTAAVELMAALEREED